MDHRASNYWLPSAWRGVASPGYLQLAHWRALVEELGGLRAPLAAACPAGEGAGSNPFCQAGPNNMSAVLEVRECEQAEELREFFQTQLARHERLVLMLIHGEGLSIGEAAEVLDLPEATVGRVYAETMSALRALFSRSADGGRL
ncbi:MAG: sigma-70 family RNA polymerase sigma factor [Planctomycetes bacterium]|nr:sigma-70 family RNA polymerase sigma factor [Planctomycetota bacterium]